MNSNVTFPSDGHGHEYGSGDGHLANGVEKVGEKDNVGLRGKQEIFTETFQYRGKELKTNIVFFWMGDGAARYGSAVPRHDPPKQNTQILGLT